MFLYNLHSFIYLKVKINHEIIFYDMFSIVLGTENTEMKAGPLELCSSQVNTRLCLLV